jgi:hypothetical protein
MSELDGHPMSLCPGLTAQGYGTVVMTRHYADDGRTVDYVTVDHADPHILVSDDLLFEVSQNRPDDKQPVNEPYYAESYRFGIRIEPSPQPRFCGNGVDTCAYPSHPFCWTDNLLHIDAKDRHLVYRLTAYDLERHAWQATFLMRRNG